MTIGNEAVRRLSDMVAFPSNEKMCAKQAKKCRAVVHDLRNNGGSDTMTVMTAIGCASNIVYERGPFLPMIETLVAKLLQQARDSHGASIVTECHSVHDCECVTIFTCQNNTKFIVPVNADCRRPSMTSATLEFNNLVYVSPGCLFSLVYRVIEYLHSTCEFIR